MRTTFLTVGEPAPWFVAPTTSQPQFHFHIAAGRYIVLCFFGSAGAERGRRVLSDFLEQRRLFDDENCCFFGVTSDPDDQRHPNVQDQIPGIRFFLDFDRDVSRRYGVIDAAGNFRPCTYVLDERLRVIGILPFDNPEGHVSTLAGFLRQLPALSAAEPARVQAPVLVVPYVFEPELCRRLIGYYDRMGGKESGFMLAVDGRTVPTYDNSFKRRRDQIIEDEALRNSAMYRIHDRLVPEIQKAFQFQATRMERHIVACYDGSSGGYFLPHRDNATPGTAHRRFAVSLNLNTGEYDGGLLRFPEFGRQTYTAPVGGAVVFSCSLLHEATPVTRGRRYVYLPFLYDDAAARIRESNVASLQPDTVAASAGV
jgi:peroxiredoxin/predicted 2-oxoglutarate/Fe(II)-dependent dioxygenase YbiX